MSTCQSHGKAFEREVISTCFGITKEVAESFGDQAIFDIPLGVITCKHETGDPVSIKTAAANAAKAAASVCLSDARRVWSWAGPLMLVVGVYEQKGSFKQVHSVYEFKFMLDDDERTRLYGSISYEEVRGFHETLRAYGAGAHAKARAWAKTQKRLLQPRAGVLQLNPKIDSKSQRRLQCSASIAQLVSACKELNWTISTGSDSYRGLQLPYEIASTSRRFSSTVVEESPAVGIGFVPAQLLQDEPRVSPGAAQEASSSEQPPGA